MSNELEPDLAKAKSIIHELHNEMAKMLDYFDNRADADWDQDGPIPNEEMTIYNAANAAYVRASEFLNGRGCDEEKYRRSGK